MNRCSPRPLKSYCPIISLVLVIICLVVYCSSPPTHDIIQPSSQLISDTEMEVGTPPTSNWPYADNLDNAVQANPNRISNRYAPIILTRPTSTMPDHFAPCIAARHPLSDRIYAEELVYPDFAIPFPIFGRAEDRERWISRLGEISDRGAARQREGGWVLEYKGQHGQNYVSTS